MRVGGVGAERRRRHPEGDAAAIEAHPPSLQRSMPSGWRPIGRQEWEMQHGLSGRGRRPDKRRCAGSAVWARPRGRVVWFAAHPRPVSGWLAAPGYQDASYRPIIGRQDLLPDAPRSRRPVASSAGTKRRLFILFVALDACRETALQVRKSALRGTDSTNTVRVCIVCSWRSCGKICVFGSIPVQFSIVKWTLESMECPQRPMTTADPQSMCGPTLRTG